MLSHYSAPPTPTPQFSLRATLGIAAACVISFAAGILLGGGQAALRADQLASSALDLSQEQADAYEKAQTSGGKSIADEGDSFGESISKDFAAVTGGTKTLLGGSAPSDNEAVQTASNAASSETSGSLLDSITSSQLGNAAINTGLDAGTGALLGGLAGGKDGAKKGALAGGALSLANSSGVLGESNGQSLTGRAMDGVGNLFGESSSSNTQSHNSGSVCLSPEEAAAWRTANPIPVEEIDPRAGFGVSTGGKAETIKNLAELK